MILVIGGTGFFGRQTVEALVAAGHQVRALTRNPDAAALPEEVEVVRGDLTRPETLPPALVDVSAAFLVLPYGLNASPLLEAMRRARVERIVFLSSGAVADGADAQPDVIAEYHHGVEQEIMSSRADWTILRILFPAINSLPFAMQLAEGDVVRGPYADAASAPIHENDVADVAVQALTGDGHAGKIYDLTGPESLTQAEQVRVLGNALGRTLSFEELDPVLVRRQMAQFMDSAFVNALFDLMAGGVGKPAPVNSLVEEITGHPARTYEQWAAGHIADFPSAK